MPVFAALERSMQFHGQGRPVRKEIGAIQASAAPDSGCRSRRRLLLGRLRRLPHRIIRGLHRCLGHVNLPPWRHSCLLVRRCRVLSDVGVTQPQAPPRAHRALPDRIPGEQVYGCMSRAIMNGASAKGFAFALALMHG